MQSENVQSEYDCLVKIGVRKRSHCYWETRSNVKGQHAPTRSDNQRQKYMKNNNKNSPFVADFGCNRRYGSHLMIAMIFVAKITFKTVQEFPTVSLDFTPT